ncbi:restriction endonuclease subunit S [Haliea sp.]|uniref:restriction endonuclease subunit S n=1 Tax=Haliea sp. TaxID=1932666 RepID=UPI003526F613
MSWSNITIGDLVGRAEAEVKTGPFGTQLRASDYVEKGTPVINVRNIGFGNIRHDKLEYIPEDVVTRLSGHLLRKGDIVFGRKGAVERHVYITDAQNRWFQGSDCLRLRLLSEENVLSKYLSFTFLTHEHQSWMMQQCSHGATMASLNQDIIKRIHLRLPSIEQQKIIVDILSAYDDLIENNTRRIGILEEIARRLYEEWFVHFRFPGHEEVSFKESELGRNPEGWEVKGLYDIAEVTYGHPFKAKQFNDHREGLGAVRIRDIRDGQVKTYTTEEGKPKHIIENGDILVGMDGQFHMGKWAGGKAWLVQRVARFRPTQPMSRYLLFLTIERPIKHLEETIVGTTVAHLSAKDLKAMKVVVPEEATLKIMADALEPMYELEMRLKRKNVNLRAQRDLLLPKLVSGEIDASNISMPNDKEVEAA